MRDVVVSSSEVDRQKAEPIVQALSDEGWDVAWSPGTLTSETDADVDLHVGSAGAVVVIWSGQSRACQHVHVEAGAGLFKNKLVQVRFDQDPPPRPFDRREVADLGAWRGERDDPRWRQFLGAVRLIAGAPGLERALARRSALTREQAQAAEAAAPVAARAGRTQIAVRVPGLPAAAAGDTVSQKDLPAVLSAKAMDVVSAGLRSRTAQGLVVLAVGAAGVLTWTALRDTHKAEDALATSLTAEAGAPTAERMAWSGVNQDDADSLRGFIAAHPESAFRGTAEARLNLIDAQTWADAVTADTEVAYLAYLAKFPVDTPSAGKSSSAALERIASLKMERASAISAIQSGLRVSGAYAGPVSGKVDPALRTAVAAFARGSGAPAPDLDAASPRELLRFSDAVFAAAGARPQAATFDAASEELRAREARAALDAQVKAAAAQAAEMKAAAAAAAKLQAEQQKAAEQKLAAQKAAAQKLAEDKAAEERAAAARAARAAQLAAAASTPTATRSALTPPPVAAAAPAKAQVAAPAAAGSAVDPKEAVAWRAASAANTVASYTNYLAAYPDGAHAAEAKAARVRVEPTPFGLNRVSPELRDRIEKARAADEAAKARAAEARRVAAQAEEAARKARAGEPGHAAGAAADGGEFATEVVDGVRTGLGVKVDGGVARGDTYRGQWRNNVAAGVGVFEYGANANNAAAAESYAGTHAGNQADGHGVTAWKNGNRYSGQMNDGAMSGVGAFTFSNGQRYEGEVRNGALNGMGAVWSKDGDLIAAGRFENGKLVEPDSNR